MSNLHKDLNDAQLHVPKGFVNASNNTKLTKDNSGNLVWATDTAGGVTSIIAGDGITISPNTGTGDVTIINNGIPSMIAQSFRGCFDYTPPKGEKSATMSNLFGRQLGCSENRHSDFYHATDFGSSTYPINPSPNLIIEASELTIPIPCGLKVFQGNILTQLATNVVFDIAVTRPDCENGRFGELNKIATFSVSAKANTMVCFRVVLTSNNILAENDILIPLIQTDGANSIKYNATLLYQP